MDSLTLMLCALVIGANAYGRSPADPLQRLYRYHYRRLLRTFCQHGMSGRHVVHLMHHYMHFCVLNKTEIEMALVQAGLHQQAISLQIATTIVHLIPRSSVQTEDSSSPDVSGICSGVVVAASGG